MTTPSGELVPVRRPLRRAPGRPVAVLRRLVADPRTRAVVTAAAAVGVQQGVRRLAVRRRSAPAAEEPVMTAWAARAVEVTVVRRVRPVR